MANCFILPDMSQIASHMFFSGYIKTIALIQRLNRTLHFRQCSNDHVKSTFSIIFDILRATTAVIVIHVKKTSSTVSENYICLPIVVYSCVFCMFAIILIIPLTYLLPVLKVIKVANIGSTYIAKKIW